MGVLVGFTKLMLSSLFYNHTVMLDLHRLAVSNQSELWYTPGGKYTVDDFYEGWDNIMKVGVWSMVVSVWHAVFLGE